VRSSLAPRDQPALSEAAETSLLPVRRDSHDDGGRVCLICVADPKTARSPSKTPHAWMPLSNRRRGPTRATPRHRSSWLAIALSRNRAVVAHSYDRPQSASLGVSNLENRDTFRRHRSPTRSPRSRCLVSRLTPRVLSQFHTSSATMTSRSTSAPAGPTRTTRLCPASLHHAVKSVTQSVTLGGLWGVGNYGEMARIA
jgi:hypothetical protein